MRIQTRLFLGTAMLVLALTAVQWWLHQRQLDAVGSELSAVATAVGRALLTGGPEVVVRRLTREAGAVAWVAEGGAEAVARDVHVVVVPEDAEAEVSHRFERTFGRRPSPAADGGSVEVDDEVEIRVEAEVVADRLELVAAPDAPPPADGAAAGEARRFVLQVVADDDGAERFLVVSGDDRQLTARARQSRSAAPAPNPTSVTR